MPVCRQVGHRREAPVEVELVGRGTGRVESGERDGGVGGAAGALCQPHTVGRAQRLDRVTAGVVAEPGGEVDGVVERGQAEGNVGWAAAHVLRGGTVRSGDDVDERLAHDEATRHGQPSIISTVPNQPGRSKRCWLSMVRIVPLRERITSEWVRPELLPYRTPRSSSPSVIPVAAK